MEKMINIIVIAVIAVWAILDIVAVIVYRNRATKGYFRKRTKEENDILKARNEELTKELIHCHESYSVQLERVSKNYKSLKKEFDDYVEERDRLHKENELLNEFATEVNKYVNSTKQNNKAIFAIRSAYERLKDDTKN